jgi:hypothetical protein
LLGRIFLAAVFQPWLGRIFLAAIFTEKKKTILIIITSLII